MMFRKNPKLLRKELKDPDALALLLRRLEDVDPDDPGEAFPFLVRLGEVSKAGPIGAAGRRLFRATSRDDVRLYLVAHLAGIGDWDDVVADRLDAIRGTDAEIAFVRGLADEGQPAIAEDAIARRLGAVADEDPATWLPWLRLVAGWKGKGEAFGDAFAKMLGRADALAPRSLHLLLTGVGNADWGSGPPDAVLAAVRRHVDHGEPFVRAAAITSLGELKDTASADAIEAVVRDDDEDKRVRQAAIHALATIAGEDGIAAIAKAGHDPFLTLDAVYALKHIGSRKGLPFLHWVATTHWNGIIRGRARRAMTHLAGK